MYSIEKSSFSYERPHRIQWVMRLCEKGARRDESFLVVCLGFHRAAFLAFPLDPFGQLFSCFSFSFSPSSFCSRFPLSSCCPSAYLLLCFFFYFMFFLFLLTLLLLLLLLLLWDIFRAGISGTQCLASKWVGLVWKVAQKKIAHCILAILAIQSQNREHFHNWFFFGDLTIFPDSLRSAMLLAAGCRKLTLGKLSKTF